MDRPPFDDSAARVIQQVATGLYQTQALYVAVSLGVADELAEGPVGVDALADRLSVQPDALFRVLRYLCSLGIFEQSGERGFANNSVSDLLRSSETGSMGDLALLFGGDFYPAWGNLLETVRGGQDAFRITYGSGLFDFLKGHPDRARAFDKAMAGGSAFFGVLPDAFDFTPYRCVVDVGGGNGAALIPVLQRYPLARGVVADTEQVLGRAGQSLADAGLADRCRLEPTDFFDSIPRGGDVYMFSRVLHDWSDDQCIRILKNCRRVVDAPGRLLILERLIPGPLALGADLNMLAVTEGRERTRQQMEELLGRGGFELLAVTELPLEVNLLEAVPS